MTVGPGSSDRKSDRGVTILVLEDDGRATRTFRISRSKIAWLKVGAWFAAGVVLVLVVGWGYLFLRALRVGVLEDQVAQLTARETQVQELAQTLEEVEAEYERLRSLFGPEGTSSAGALWLPPSRGASAVGASETEPNPDAPTRWPLTTPGFLTQTLLEGATAQHPGIDIAVPTGAYVRAAGAGVVVERSEDPVYGQVLVLEHSGGYRTRYAHNSVILADTGMAVRAGEVIALSGSSGRSTAPHLHFEILQEGAPIDPLTLVNQP